MGKMAKKTNLAKGGSKFALKKTSSVKNPKENVIGKRKNKKNKNLNVKASVDNKPPKTVNKAIKQNGKPLQSNKREQEFKSKVLKKAGKAEVSEKNTTKNENEIKNIDIKLSKRIKNRAKAIIKSEILEKKTIKALSDPNVLNKKLEKLKVKLETAPSMKVRKKVLVLEKLIENAKQKSTNKQKNTTTANKQKTKKVDASKLLNNTAESSISGKQDAKQSDIPASENGIYEVFVGGLPKTTKVKELHEHFSTIEGIIKIDMKKGKRKRSKSYAFVHCKDEGTRQKMLAMHGTKLNDRIINISYGGKNKSKDDVKKLNSMPLVEQKKNTLTEEQAKKLGTQLQEKNKKKKVGERLQKNKNKNKKKMKNGKSKADN